MPGIAVAKRPRRRVIVNKTIAPYLFLLIDSAICVCCIIVKYPAGV